MTGHHKRNMEGSTLTVVTVGRVCYRAETLFVEDRCLTVLPLSTNNSLS